MQTAKKHTSNCLISLAFKEMQSKAMMIHHYMSIKTDKVKSGVNTKSREGVEKLDLSFIADGDVKLDNMAVLKLTIYLTYNVAIVLLDGHLSYRNEIMSTQTPVHEFL